MTTHQILNFQQSPAAMRDAGCLAAGAAITLKPRASTVLRVAEGQAWVTLTGGAGGKGEASGDIFLFPGQALTVAAGQEAVVEALDGRPLRYRCTPAAAEAGNPAPWWRRAAFGSISATPGLSNEAWA